MPFQPALASKPRQRHVVPGDLQHRTHLEATGMLLAVTGTVIRGSALPSASVITHPGCTMRMSVAPAFRKCQNRAREKEDLSRGTDWLEKVQMASKHQAKTASKIPLLSKQNRMALPQMIREDNKDFEKPGQKAPSLPACFSHAKATPLGSTDMTPWSGPSQSETSFQVLFKPMVSFLHSVPFSAAGAPGLYSFFPELGEKTPTAEGEQRRKAKTKQKAHHRGSPRHFRGKWQGMKLPPVPAITNLNFSRNFTFSFFELPPHQNHQYWVQRQQLTRFLMKQLQ